MTTDTIMQGAEPFSFRGNDIGVLVATATGTTQACGRSASTWPAPATPCSGRASTATASPQASRTTAVDWIASVDRGSPS